MASQTKVDSAGRSAAERRTEGSSASHASTASASGTFASRGDARTSGSQRSRDDDLVGESTEEALDSASEHDAEPASEDGDFATPRVSSIEELGRRPAQRAAEDDEDVSLDELLISDSAEDDDDEDEATDIHPGLSEAVLAESLRGPPVPVIVAESPRVPEEEAAAPSDALEPVDEVAAEADSPALDAAEEREPEPVVAADSLPASEELTAPDASPADALEPEQPAAAAAVEAQEAALEAEAAFEVEAALEAEAAPDSVAEAVLEDAAAEDAMAEAVAEEDADLAAAEAEESEEAPMSAELELDDAAASEPPAKQGERQTLPETVAAKRRDAPLPSFDIPDLEVVAAAPAPAASGPRKVVQPVAMPPLAEIDEDDDDDAVTHMGLPVAPEAANDRPPSAAGGGFQVADPAVAALESLDADIARGDSRRATTRVIPRVDPKSIPAKPRVYARSGPPLTERLTSTLRDAWSRVSQLAQFDAGAPLLDLEAASPARRRLGWFVENVLPPLSLVLFGSGLGAGIIMLVESDRADGAVVQGQAVQALQESAKAPVTLADRARLGDGDALYKVTNLPQNERTSALTLALEAGYQAQKLREFKEFAKSAAVAPSALHGSDVARMVEYATSPETMLPAFQELTQWPGPVGPDVLYAVWEKAAGGSRAASLAQQLLYSADQRAKATPALSVALDLRSAASCDDYLRVLPAAQRDGDQRSSASLRALRHKDGCGADGQQDCYACLREGSALDDALKAIDGR